MNDTWRLEGPFNDMPCRVITDFPDGDYDDTFHDVTGWQLWHGDKNVADIVTPPGSSTLELWHEGDMVEVASPAHALEVLAAALSVERFVRSLYWNKRNPPPAKESQSP